jgi:hypothetical protein
MRNSVASLVLMLAFCGTARAAGPVRLEVLPGNVTLAPGGMVIFTALAHAKDGTSHTPAGLVWFGNGGIMGAKGSYKAGPREGKYNVIVMLGAARATANVTIRKAGGLAVVPPAGRARVELDPKIARLTVGQTVQLRAFAYDNRGKRTPLAPVWKATGGAISAAGVFTATRIGRHTVTVTDRRTGLRGTALMIVTGTGVRRIVRLAVQPGRTILAPGKRVAFRVIAYDRLDRVMPCRPGFAATGGTISIKGLFTAGAREGIYQVVVTDPAGTARSVATVVIKAGYTPPIGPVGRGRIVVKDWEIKTGFLKSKARLDVQVFGKDAAKVTMYAVEADGDLDRLESAACKDGQTVHLSEKFSPANTKFIEVRLFDSRGRVMAKLRRALK